MRESFDGPQERVANARALLDMLVKATEGSNDAYCFLLRNEFEILRRTSDSYLLHEHLEADNEPMYFHQFMEMADAHGLQFLAESYLLSTWISQTAGPAEKVVRDLASDILELEQYTDFLRNRMFRKTLLCRKGIDLVREFDPRVLQSMYVACRPAADRRFSQRPRCEHFGQVQQRKRDA